MSEGTLISIPDCGNRQPCFCLLRTRAALAAPQARVAELEAQNATLSRTNAHIRAESAAKDAALHTLREALEAMRAPEPYDPDTAQWSEPGDEELRATLHVEMKRRWALADAALSLEAVKLAADAQARRDEAIAEAVREACSAAASSRDTEAACQVDALHLEPIIRAALAKVKP